MKGTRYSDYSDVLSAPLRVPIDNFAEGHVTQNIHSTYFTDPLSIFHKREKMIYMMHTISFLQK